MNVIKKRDEYIDSVEQFKWLGKVLESCSESHFKEVKTFHPTGKKCPDTNHVHKGFFYNECEKNKNSFVINEKIHGEQYALKNYKGGMIVFSIEVNAENLSDNKIINHIKQFVLTLKNRFTRNSILDKIVKKFNGDTTKLIDEKIYNYTVGKFFKGRYLSDDNHTFDETSTSIEVNGLSSSGLLLLAEFIAKSFKQETVLVKDFNKDKIYLADSEKFEGSLEELDDEIEKLNTGV